MLSRRLVFMLLLLGAAPAALTAAPRESMSAVSIRIHDYSQFDGKQLQQAQRQVSETYRAIGVLLDWRDVVRPAEVAAGRAEWPTDPQVYVQYNHKRRVVYVGRTGETHVEHFPPGP